jgi:hypothetical protein
LELKIMSQPNRSPWFQPDAVTWASGNEAMRRFTRLILKTLENDPRQFPIQMRAAASMVIMLCREGMWPAHDKQELDDVVGQARRNLSVIREFYSIESKRRDDVATHASLNRLLKTIETEMRILDARQSEEPLNIPNEPPEAWGNIWPKP